MKKHLFVKTNHMDQPVASLSLMLALWILFGAANFGVIVDYIRYGFDDGTYSHAFLIPFISMFLIWRSAKHNSLILRAYRWRLVFAIGLSLLMCVSFIAQFPFLYRLLFPTVLIAYVASLFVPNASALLPAAMLYFMAPIWGVLITPLQTASTKAVSVLMSITNVPAYVEGNVINIPAGSFEIAGGCSGLRYLIVSLALATLYCHFNLRRRRSCAKVFAVFIAGSLLVNWLRIVGLILIGHYTNMQSEIINDHNMFGWYVYIPFLLIFFIYGNHLIDKEGKVRSASSGESNMWSGSSMAEFKKTRLVFVAVVILSISTSTADMLSMPDSKELDSDVKSATLFRYAPKVVDPSAITYKQSTVNGVTIHALRYVFHGTSDSNKATYFRNLIVPENLRILGLENDSRTAIAKVAQPDGNLGIVAYSYVLGGTRTADKKTYRLLRLASALKLDRSSELEWTYLKCGSTRMCDELSQRILSQENGPPEWQL